MQNNDTLFICQRKNMFQHISNIKSTPEKNARKQLPYLIHHLEMKKFKTKPCSVQSLSCVRLFATPCIAARQASLPITNSQSSLRLASIESVMPSSHLILCHPVLLLSPIPPSIRVFSNESALRRR